LDYLVVIRRVGARRPLASSRCSNISSNFRTVGCRRCQSPGIAAARSKADSAGSISIRTRRSSAAAHAVDRAADPRLRGPAAPGRALASDGAQGPPPGDRHIKTFAKKRDADAHHAIVSVTVRAGTHTADSKSVTVAKAAELWLASCDAAGLERTTITAYRQHGNLLFSKYRAKVSQKVRMWERDKDVTSSRIIQ
jgi:hypothetical protein